MTMSTTLLDREIVYPDSDGEPMADNTRQFRWIVTIENGLEALFADRPDVFVAGDLLWYPLEGDNKTRAASDAMVVFGRPKGDRGSYRQWCEDGIPPQVVFEVLSPGNSPREMEAKRAFYERHGVEEYYLYDPDHGALQGWRRVGGVLQPIHEMRGWISPRLGVRFDLEGLDLCLYRPDGERFTSYLQAREQIEQEKQRAEQEKQRADRAEQRARQQAQAQLEAIPRLRRLGLTTEQIAQALNVPEQVVRESEDKG
jgi:Uma2 family endonuclease/DNA-binding transcriptional regulator YiaG